MTAESIATQAASLAENLEGHCSNVLEQLKAAFNLPGRIPIEIRTAFAGAVDDVAAVKIAPLSDEDGSFRIEDGVLTLNEDRISRLLTEVNADFERRREGGKLPIDRDQLLEVIRSVSSVFMLHELRHRTQGVEKLSRVGELKAIAGYQAMSQFDVIADRDAALAYAAINSDLSDRLEFLSRFKEAIFFSSAYFFRVFPIPSDRHDKIERAIGVFVMAARLALQDIENSAVVENPGLPLDAPLYVVLKQDRTELAVFRGEPSRRLLATANDDNAIAELIGSITASDFDTAIANSVWIAEVLQKAA